MEISPPFPFEGGRRQPFDAILGQLGLTTSDYTRLALHQLVLQRGLPFAVQMPGGKTAARAGAGEAAAAIAEPR